LKDDPVEVLTTRIPEDLLKDIQQIEKDERSERAEVVRKLLDTAVQEWKIAKALRMISEGRWTVRRATKFAGTTYHEILEKMTDRGVDSGPTLRDLRDALDHS
jgi:Arc/MetJ-type ribon-helix-helix transcriptional regulator